MNTGYSYKSLDLNTSFLDNIKRRMEQDENETIYFGFEKSHLPDFRYYKDDTNLNLNPAVVPKFTYKNKSLFPREKPIQTEHDEIGINQPYLNKHFGYTDYGNFNIANQSLPEANKHKKTPKNNIYELL